MSETERRVIMRCPVCFARENDVTLLQNGDVYYCVHCSWHGSAHDIRQQYANLQEKYRWKCRRVTLAELDEI